MFFFLFPSPPLCMEWLSQQHSWKTFETHIHTRTHTHVSGVGGVWHWGLQKFKLAPPVKITAAQKMVQCISPGLKRTFSGSQELCRSWENAAVQRSDRVCWLGWVPPLKWIIKDANLLKGVIREYLPKCICHVEMIYYQGMILVTFYYIYFVFVFIIPSWDLKCNSSSSKTEFLLPCPLSLFFPSYYLCPSYRWSEQIKIYVHCHWGAILTIQMCCKAVVLFKSAPPWWPW